MVLVASKIVKVRQLGLSNSIAFSFLHYDKILISSNQPSFFLNSILQLKQLFSKFKSVQAHPCLELLPLGQRQSMLWMPNFSWPEAAHFNSISYISWPAALALHCLQSPSALPLLFMFLCFYACSSSFLVWLSCHSFPFIVLILDCMRLLWFDL